MTTTSKQIGSENIELNEYNGILLIRIGNLEGLNAIEIDLRC
jgi:hypothetical protein